MRELDLVPKAATKREMKVRIPKNAHLARFFLGRAGRIVIVSFALFALLGIAGTFVYFYHKYSTIIDEKLRAGVFANTAKIYAAPESVAVGDPGSTEEIAAQLRRSGYSESRDNPIGSYQIHLDTIEIFPGKESYFDQEAGMIRFAGGKISQIVSLQDNTVRGFYQLEPKLITNVSGTNREKRRFVKFRDIPLVLVQAVTSAEDKRFFQHAGFDPIRIVKAVYVDLKEGRKDQGASTLSMQLARIIWLDQGKRWTRKLSEVIITLQLEQKLTKEQIFEDYANEIYLGSRGSFRIHGFGEASEAFLGKDLSQVTLPEAAELAGMIQNPAHFDPYHHPDRTKERRNLVLSMMRQNGFVNDRDYALSVDAPMTVPKGTAQSVEAPYFADLVNDTLQSKFQDEDFANNASRIYTTLDLRLQRAAGDAVQKGMVLVDEQIKKQRRFKGHEIHSRAAGGAGGDRPAQRGGARARGGPQLRREPVGPRAAAKAAGIHLQAIRLRRRARYGRGGQRARADRKHHRERRADHVLLRGYSALYPEQFRKEILRAGDPAGGAGPLLERGHGQGGGNGGLPVCGGYGQPRGHELPDQADTGGGVGRVRYHADGGGRRLHHVRQRRPVRAPGIPDPGARPQRPDDVQGQAAGKAGAGSAGCLPGDEPDAGGDAQRHGGRCARAIRLQCARRGQDRNVARRMVRRLYLGAVVRGVGGLRR